MPLPPKIISKIPTSELTVAVDSLLKEDGLTEKQSEFQLLLEEAGLTNPVIASELANLLYTSKESTKFKVLEKLLSLKQLNPKTEEVKSQLPTIVFNIQTEGPIQINSGFAPKRMIDGN